MQFTDIEIEKLSAINENIDDAAHYAMLLGLKLIESGFDTDDLIRALQEPGTGLDIHLIMAKKKSRGETSFVSDCAIYEIGKSSPIDWSIQNIPEDAYDTDFDED